MIDWMILQPVPLRSEDHEVTELMILQGYTVLMAYFHENGDMEFRWWVSGVGKTLLCNTNCPFRFS